MLAEGLGLVVSQGLGWKPRIILCVLKFLSLYASCLYHLYTTSIKEIIQEETLKQVKVLNLPTSKSFLMTQFNLPFSCLCDLLHHSPCVVVYSCSVVFGAWWQIKQIKSFISVFVQILLQGQIVVASPQHSLHFSIVDIVLPTTDKPSSYTRKKIDILWWKLVGQFQSLDLLFDGRHLSGIDVQT